MKLCVIDSGVANIASVLFALERLNVQATLSRDPNIINSATHIILPGVGHARAAMQALAQADLVELIPALTQPVLGICLGMQLLFTHSAEGDTPTLGIIPQCIERLPDSVITPHMGWDQLTLKQAHPLTENINTGDYCYFVHSYAAPIGDYTVASCDYGHAFSAIVAYQNFYGCQFHPERSSTVGAQIIQNFLNLR